MLLENNTERVMNLVDMIDDLNAIDKIRLAIHLLEESYFLLNMMRMIISWIMKNSRLG